MTLSNRENTFETITFGKPEFVPMTPEAFCFTGTAVSAITDCPLVDGGVDGFGVPWAHDNLGSMPKPGFVMFDDIEDWEDHVHVPDLDSVDIKGIAQRQLAEQPVDRENKLVQIMRPTGLFQRLIALMGFENALCALAEDPEECMKLFEVIANYMIDYNDRVIDAYGPDVFIYSDDISTARDLFVSPDTYDSLIAPFHKAIAEGIRKHEGVIAEYHECGKSGVLVDRWPAMGFQIWHSANCANDLVGVLDRQLICVEGGWDSQGPASWAGSTREQVREEARRCMTEYKRVGYILCPILMNERGNSLVVGDDRLPDIKEVWDEMRWFDSTDQQVADGKHEDLVEA